MLESSSLKWPKRQQNHSLGGCTIHRTVCRLPSAVAYRFSAIWATLYLKKDQTVKPKFHGSSFLVANVTRMSTNTLRGNRAWRVTSFQFCGKVLWIKPTVSAFERTANTSLSYRIVSYCYEDATRKLVAWNLCSSTFVARTADELDAVELVDAARLQDGEVLQLEAACGTWLQGSVVPVRERGTQTRVVDVVEHTVLGHQQGVTLERTNCYVDNTTQTHASSVYILTSNSTGRRLRSGFSTAN